MGLLEEYNYTECEIAADVKDNSIQPHSIKKDNRCLESRRFQVQYVDLVFPARIAL